MKDCGNDICVVVEQIERLDEACVLVHSIRVRSGLDESQRASLEVAQLRMQEAIDKIKGLKKACGMYDHLDKKTEDDSDES